MPRIIPKTLKDKNKPLNIAYGFAQTTYGEVLIGWLSDKASNSICHMHFVQKNHHAQVIPELQKRWPQATLAENTKLAEQLVKKIFAEEPNENVNDAIEVMLAGTAFQQTVWEALLQIPVGSNCTYSEVAQQIAKPKAVRAVANAVANNAVAVLIPCHRVVAKDGNKFKYRWGAELKRKLLENEGEQQRKSSKKISPKTEKKKSSR